MSGTVRWFWDAAYEIHPTCIHQHYILPAGRFRQVQVLTAMANAFYSLYSHVSRTPLQKLATPEFSFSSPVERIERFRSTVRSEPRSPVERLKDTVSKMCLYTGSPRGSDSTSPQPSPQKRSSLPDVVDIVLEKVKIGVSKKLDLGERNKGDLDADVSPTMDGDKSCGTGKEEQTQQTVVDTEPLQSGNQNCEMQDGQQTDNVRADDKGVRVADLDSGTYRTSLASSLSGETVIEKDHRLLARQPELDSTQSHTETAHLKPVAKVTYDLICPQIVESTHQAPFSMRCPKTNTPISSVTESIDRSCPGSQAAASEASHSGASASLPVMASDSGFTQCYITVTSSEGDAPDSTPAWTVPPVLTCEEPISEGYLKPLTQQGPGQVSSNLQQVNSFELEEVQ